MSTNQIASDFFSRIKDQLLKEVLEELRPAIAIELDQRRLTVSEASRYTGVSEDTIYTLCREKKIPHYKVGASNSRRPKIFFRIDSLDKWMSKQEQENCAGWE